MNSETVNLQFVIRNPQSAIEKGEIEMDDDAMHRLLEGILTLILTTLAAWLARQIVRQLLGPRKEEA